MNDVPSGGEDRLASLEKQLVDTRELAVVGLKAAISAISALEMMMQGLDARFTRGDGRQAQDSFDRAMQHVRRGLDLLRAAIEEPGP